MKTLKDKWRSVHGGRYFAKRGAIDWGAFPFDKHPFAVAIMIDDCSLMRSDGRSVASVTCEVFAKMPESKETASIPEIDDELLDDMLEDVETVLMQFEATRDPKNPDYPVVYTVLKETATCVESHDVDLKVQGLVVQFEIRY